MKLSDIKGTYDLALSLGAPCQPAEQLRRHGLRSFSGPFDWTVLESVPCLIKAIESKFDNYFSFNNLVLKGRHDHTYLIFDQLYQCMSVHDFPLVANDNIDMIFDAYPLFIEKMQRRIKRFYERISQSKKTLFVRYHANYQDTQALQKCLKNLTNDNFVLLVLNESNSKEFIEENWDIENTYSAKICQSPDIPWQGYTPHWDKLLNGIYLKNYEIDKDISLFDPDI